MIDKRMWVFRLSLGYGGEPVNECPTFINRQDVKQDIEIYKKEVSSIDVDSYPDLDMEVLKHELFRRGKLRQGWGMELDKINLDLRQPIEDWIKNFIKLYWKIWDEEVDCPIAMGRWNILKLMKDMKIGDIVFIPKIPDDSKFTVATVKKEYYFQKIDGFIGHGHVVEVKKIKDFSYQNHFQPIIFNPYRKAVGEAKKHHQNYKKLDEFINKYYS